MRATRATVHISNFKANIRTLQSVTNRNVPICIAVKAVAYGHGVLPICRAAREEGVNCFAVATVEEGLELRQHQVTGTIILLGIPLPEEIEAAVSHDLSMVVTRAEQIERLKKSAEQQYRRVKVHLKIDSGMNRLGCSPEKAPQLAEMIKASLPLEFEGTCTHFAIADTPEGSEATAAQLRIFLHAVEAIKAKGIDPGTLHAANSGAALNYPQTHLGMIRPGILLYGYPPKESRFLERFLPVMGLESRIIAIKRVKAGQGVSYGATYRTKEPSIIATVSAGYADGISRQLSNRGEVIIRNRRYPIAGTICMDLCMVNLGPDSDIELYEPVYFFGPPPLVLNAREVAEHINSIPYEVLTSVSKRVPRMLIE